MITDEAATSTRDGGNRAALPLWPDEAYADHGQVGEDGNAPAPLWEWAVARDELGASAGLSETCHGAMQALSESLIQCARPRTGHVRPVILTNPIREDSCYIRDAIKHTAIYDGGVIRWQ